MRRGWLILPVALLIFAPTTTEAQAGTPNPQRAVVQQFITRMGEHIQAGNFTALDSMFPPRGLHILTDTVTLHGWAEYRDRFLKPEIARHPNLKFAHSAVEAVVRGDIAWVAFRQQYTTDATPAAIRMTGRGTAVLEKREGRWLIVHMHISR